MSSKLLRHRSNHASLALRKCIRDNNLWHTHTLTLSDALCGGDLFIKLGRLDRRGIITRKGVRCIVDDVEGVLAEPKTTGATHVCVCMGLLKSLREPTEPSSHMGHPDLRKAT